MATASRSAVAEALSNVVIMSCISEHVREDVPVWLPSRRDLCQLSLVSKAWREVAARQLYRKVKWLDPGAGRRVRIPDDYLLHVRELAVNIDPDLKAAEEIVSTLMGCHNLDRLELYGKGWHLLGILDRIKWQYPDSWNDLVHSGLNGRDPSDGPVPALLNVRHLSFYADPSGASMPSEWPIRLPSITSLELMAENPTDAQIIELLPCLRRLSMTVRTRDTDLVEEFWRRFSEMSHPTIESVKLDQTDFEDGLGIVPYPLRDLASPDWTGAIETSYAFDKEKTYASEWLAAARGRMPQLRDVEMMFNIDDWSSDIRDFSVGHGYMPLEEIFLRILIVKASVQGSGDSGQSIQSSARWRHIWSDHVGVSSAELSSADRHQFAQQNGIDVTLVHFLLATTDGCDPPDSPRWPTPEYWDEVIVNGARFWLEQLRAGQPYLYYSPSSSPRSASFSLSSSPPSVSSSLPPSSPTG